MKNVYDETVEILNDMCNLIDVVIQELVDAGKRVPVTLKNFKPKAKIIVEYCESDNYIVGLHSASNARPSIYYAVQNYMEYILEEGETVTKTFKTLYELSEKFSDLKLPRICKSIVPAWLSPTGELFTEQSNPNILNNSHTAIGHYIQQIKYSKEQRMSESGICLSSDGYVKLHQDSVNGWIWVYNKPLTRHQISFIERWCRLTGYKFDMILMGSGSGYKL